MDLETLLVSLYVLVDEWWQQAHPPEPKKPGRPSSLSESEVLTPANCDERPIGSFLVASDGHDGYLADKGISSVEWEKRWLTRFGALVGATPQRNTQRAWPEDACRWAAGKRQLIEGVIWQLKDYFCLERHRAKTMGGLLARLAAKVAAYTPAANSSTPRSVGRCATWQIS
jgi:hypothetical protein